MNKFVCTAKIISYPKISMYRNKLLVQFFLCLQNTKKKNPTYIVKAQASSKLGYKVFHYYRIGKVFLLEGFMVINFQKEAFFGKGRAKKKEACITINKIH
nr:putative single-stranded DNA binding protein [Gloiopeltis furcata]